MLSEEMMAILCCPKCRGKLHLVDSPQGLACPQCRLHYAIVDDIPNLLIEEATAYVPSAGAAGAAGDGAKAD